MSESPPSVAELSEYCRTQARLLWGRVETIDEATDELLAEIDDDIDDLRAAIEAREGTTTVGTEQPETTDDAVGDLEARESEIETKQADAEAKQARRTAFADLAAGYVDLAEELDGAVTETDVAVTRIVEFEADRDAPAYFEEETLLEAALESAE